MAQEPIAQPHRHTMERLEAAKRVTEDGIDYWFARDIGPILGYPTWQNFEPAITRAEEALRASGRDPSHQIMPTHRMMERGGGAQTEGRDYFLTRGASYLIAMNGEPSKPEVAAAQIYFAAKARQMEVIEEKSADQKRLDAREKVSVAHRLVSGVAQDAGVQSRMQAVFHGARFQGLYRMTRAEVAAAKGLRDGENLLDRAGALELSMHEFQMNLAAEVIAKEGIKSQQGAIDRNKRVAAEVRQAVINSRGRAPEDIAVEPESISAVKKRLKAQAKAIEGPKTDPSA